MVLDESAFPHEPHFALVAAKRRGDHWGVRSSAAKRQCDSITQQSLLSGADGPSSRSKAAEIASPVPSKGLGGVPCNCLSFCRFGPCRFLHPGSDRCDGSLGDWPCLQRRLGRWRFEEGARPCGTLPCLCAYRDAGASICGDAAGTAGQDRLRGLTTLA